MQVNTSSRAGVQVLSLSGRLDANAAAQLEQQLRSALDSGPSPRVVVDMIGVGFLGSTAIRALVIGSKLSKDAGGRLVFCNLSPEVHKVLDVSGLSLRLEIFPNLNEALHQATVPRHRAGTATGGDTRPIDVTPKPSGPSDFPFLDPPREAGEIGWLGTYRILRLLGSGGMGMVFEAEDPHLQRRIALKVMKPDVASDLNARERFLLEARTAASVPHDHIVTIFQVGQHHDVPFLAMQYLEGESLESRLEREGPLPIADVLRISREVAEGLSAAHTKGLIHRDIKPANIWLEASSPPGDASQRSAPFSFKRVRLLDFGLARQAGNNRNLTGTGLIVGTPGFLAPEQAKGLPLDHRVDLFALGCVMYCMITGNEAFGGTDVLAVLSALATEDPRPIQEIEPNAPTALCDLVHQLLEKQPAARPQSAREVADRLVAIAEEAGLPICDSKPPSGTLIVPRRPTSQMLDRRRQQAVLAAAGIAVLIATAAFFLSRSNTTVVPQGEPIRVGVLHSLSGTMRNNGQSVQDATLLAIDEVNKSGGVLGRPIAAIIRDGQSDEKAFGREASYLIEQKVCTIFGCWTSASRKMVKPIVERHKNLLVYPVQYEGLEQSPNIVYLGATPNQQILPALHYAIKALGKRRFFLVGSDYVFPRAAHAIIRDAVRDYANVDVQIVGEAYLPLGSSDVRELIEAIRKSQPDLILNTINGSSNNSFFDELRDPNRGVPAPQVPVISFSLSENELQSLDINDVAGDYAAWNYFMSIDRPENQAFIQRFRSRFGPLRVVSDPMESAYFGVHAWAQAVAKAGSTEPAAIREALKGMELSSPHGKVVIDKDNLHSWKPFRLGQIQANGQFKIIATQEELIPPVPFPTTRDRSKWQLFLEQLYQGWGQRWEAPRR